MKIMKKGKRIISFALAMLMAGMSFSPSVPAITAFADTDEPIVNPDGTNPNGNKPQDITDTARLYINNTPIRLEVSKVKTHKGDHEGINPDANTIVTDDTVTYKLSGRVEGDASNLLQKYGPNQIELAYSNTGAYLGYGWKRGTFEYLTYRKDNAEKFGDIAVDLIYNEYGVFTGYAYITRTLETADNDNRYVAGAEMTLYDAIEIFRAPDYTKDDRFQGVTVERDNNNNVTNVYVNKGYAGTKIEYVLEKTDESKITQDENGKIIDDNYTYQDEINDTGEGVWIAKTIQREDTPILYYNLSDLHITTNDQYVSNSAENEAMIDEIFGQYRFDKDHKTYGLDRNGNIVDITQKQEYDFSIFAFEDGKNRPEYEIVGGDFSEIYYDEQEKEINLGEGTIIYHLDEDGNRDAMVDPRTGIAYIEEEIENPGGSSDIHHVNGNNSKIYVWPVNIHYDGSGSKTFEKIKTNRIATINADTADEYTIGTYDSDTDTFDKSVNPTLDEHGMPIYYQKSEDTYVKGSDRYDRDGDYLGYGYTDHLDNQNLNAYEIKDHDNLYNGDEDDPFDQSTHYQYSEQQPIQITIDVNGNYVVNGNKTVPVPQRDGFEFGGWLVNVSDLVNGTTTTAKARWLNIGEMSDSEKQEWYSNRTAAGPTKTLTVTFDANGGLFINGSGDIHSTDNKLYRRQGDAYLIENTWITGENTPNDPFDEQKVRTIHQTNETGNDVYTDTELGGMADMLKRVPVGNYIMEEVNAPDGWVKGLPVGVTVNESTQIQYAEMVDTTIKIQIVKIDATDDFTYNIYENGNLLRESDRNVTYEEPSNSYKYENVQGAILSLKAADDETYRNFEKWIDATNHPDLTKQNVNGEKYVTFESDKPLFVEGIPKGNYIISEITTPDGYVTAEDKEITINETTEVITYFMNDDHTKLEIEKYYNNGYNDVVMPNDHRAGLQLLDSSGKVVAEWYTDDIKDYTATIDSNDTSLIGRIFGKTVSSGFVDNMIESVNEHHGLTGFDNISWNVKRTATLKGTEGTDEVWSISDGTTIRVGNNGAVPSEASQAFKEAYANWNRSDSSFSYVEERNARKVSGDDSYRQIWETDTGSKILISAYRDSMGSDGYPEWSVEFKFNYKDDYTGIYSNMISYDTADGYHRFDYIPEGTYTIHEFDPPEGFVAADDKTIVVEKIADLQRFDLENIRKELVISKVAQDENDKFFNGFDNGQAVLNDNFGKVYAGAELALYKVDAFSDTIKEELKTGNYKNAELIEKWTSGNDGKYTREEYVSGLIPDGYEVGDLKPHTIKSIENGYYYLIETKTPDYYKTAEPIEIEISDDSTASNLTVTMINKEIPGKIEINKVNSKGSPLTNASFVIKNITTGETVATLTTNEGKGVAIIDNIGYFDQDGNLVPYTFSIQETNPPAGYALNETIHTFTFEPTMHGDSTIAINPSDADLNNGVLTVVNDESTITLSKADFETGKIVSGVKLKVSEAEFKDGKWQSNGVTKNDWSWTTTENSATHAITGLVGGGNYILEEIEAPDGYTLSDPIFFKVSNDAKRIEKIWYDETENPFIEFESDNTGAVEKVIFTTRGLNTTGTYAKIENLTDPDQEVPTIGIPTSGELLLTSDYITDGNTYKISQIVTYSNGTEETIGTRTFLAELENGQIKIPVKYGTDMSVKVEDNNGNEIAVVDSDGTNKIIDNSLIKETEGIKVSGNGANHSAISVENGIVYYEISVDKAGSTVTLTPDSQSYVLGTEPKANEENGVYKWVTTEDNQIIKFSTNLKQGAAGNIEQVVTINDKSYSYINPIVPEKIGDVYKNTSELSVFNEVVGTDPGNETYVFTYHITLTDTNGKPLSGYFDYFTKNGVKETFSPGGNLTEIVVNLRGDDFFLIRGLPNNTKYSVRIEDPSIAGFSVRNTSADGRTVSNKTSNVFFENTRNLEEDRNLFKKNTTYTLTEITKLNDSSEIETAKYMFSIGENCEVISFTMLDKDTSVEIEKLGKDGILLPGAILAIVDPEDNSMIQIVTGYEATKINTQLIPGKEYILKEINPAPGYTYAEDIHFVVSEDGTIDTVTMKDYQTRVNIIKTDKEGNLVEGAKLQILDKNKQPVKAIITDTLFTAGEDLIFESQLTPIEITGQLEPDTTYFIREIESPTGYYIASQDVEFKTSKMNELVTVTFENTPIKYQISKVDITSRKEVPGATLILLDKENNQIDTWISTDTPHMIDSDKLTAGETYKLVEIAAPDGYHYAHEIEFTIPVNNDTDEIITVEMEDELTEIYFSKSDITTGEELPGAHIQIKDRNGNIIDEWTSTEEEHIIKGELNAGETYIMHEEGAPNGYYYTEDIEFTVPKYKEDVEKVEMKDAPVIVDLQKIDAETGLPVVGARLQILDSNENIVHRFISDGNPEIITGILNADETYTLREIAAPDGYHFTEDVKFTVPKYDNGTIYVSMQDKQTEIQISKSDITTGKEVPGANLEVRDENGDLIDSWISTEKPHIIKGKLIAGETYYLYETGAPDGYYYEEMIEFTVPRKDEGIIKVEMKDKPTEVEITKSDLTTGKEVPGAKLQIIDKNGNIIEEWTSTDTPHVIKGKLIAEETYTLREISAPDGYSYAEDIQFTISKNGPIEKVEMKDEQTHVEFTKTDFAGEEIPGAECELKVVEEDGTITTIDSWVSTEEPHIIEGVLTPGKTYYYHEAGAPDGFTYCEDIEFTLDKDGNVIDAHYVNENGDTLLYDKDGYVTEIVVKPDGTYELDGEKITIDENGNAVNEDGVIIAEGVKEEIEVEDNVIQMKDGPTEVIFKKTDATTTEELPGAHIQIIDEFGNVVEEWISTEEEHIVTGMLIVDKIYHMHEEGAPDGYGYTTDITFKVDRDNVVWIYNEETNKWETAEDSTIEMIDEILKLEVIKLEKDTSKMIGNAVLQITDSSGTVMETLTTVANEKKTFVGEFSNGTKIKADEIYTLSEISAPEGYLKAPSQTFTVNRYGTLTTITMEDTRVGKPWTSPEIETSTITFNKYSGTNESTGSTTITNDHKLAGAEYTIYRSDRSVYAIVTTGADGSVTIDTPPAGTYFFRETKAPNGYMLNRNIYSFTISSNDNVDGTLDIVDYKKPEVIISKKDSETKELLPGATFRIADSKGNIVYEGTTESNGTLVFEPDYADTYTVIEIKAPNGYQLNQTYIKFTVAENGSVSGTTEMLNVKEEEKKGTISAYYDSDFDGNGNGNRVNDGLGIDKNGNVIANMPKSGDTFNIVLLTAIWIGSISGIAYIIYKRRKNQKK